MRPPYLLKLFAVILFGVTQAAAMSSFTASAASAGQAPAPVTSLEGGGDVDAIMSRIGPPSQLTVSTYVDSGMQAPTDHHLTADEKREVRTALERLPPFFRGMLVLHLHRLSFVDGIPGVGSGLTASIGPNQDMSDLTFRTGILHESLTEFFTHKEQRCFVPDGSGIRVDIDGGGADAFPYILLHETTHVIDFALGISASRNAPDRHAPIFAGIWRDRTTLAEPYANGIIDRNVFREAEGGHPIGIAEAATLYRALSDTPFVDLFATANEAEDLSSAVAFDVLWQRDHIDPKVIVRDGAGSTIYVFDPMINSGVRARLPLVQQFLRTHPT